MPDPYQPSNGTEGMCFTEKFCEQCIHEKFTHTQDDDDKKCDIFSRTMYLTPKDDDYPKEWIYGVDGKPTCTAWVKHDWGDDDDEDDGDDYNPPSKPQPDNPWQLCLPLDDLWQEREMNEVEPELVGT